jgi:hypothetical protein
MKKRRTRKKRTRSGAGVLRRKFDFSDLSGDSTPASLGSFLRDNREFPPDPDEVARMKRVAVGGTVKLGIGGGHVTVRRVR